MDNSDQTSCCEKLFIAIRKPSPSIRTMRFTSPTTTMSDRCVRVSRAGTIAIETPSNVSLTTTTTTTNLKDRCPRISKQTVAPAATDSRKQPENKVAVIHVSQPTINLAKPKATTILPIHGHENRIPAIPHGNGVKSYIAESINGMSSEYIERAGRKIRSPTNVGVRKPSIAPDSFNDRVTDFISRTKYKFHSSPSYIEVSEGKENRLK